MTALIAGCAAKGHSLKIGGRLFSDTAGAEGTPEATLTGALRHNVHEIADALTTSSRTSAQSASSWLDRQSASIIRCRPEFFDVGNECVFIPSPRRLVRQERMF
jgi:hypothetical protein